MFQSIDKETIVLTWCYDFGCVNWGQVMQCYALYKYCKTYGQTVKVIRYRKLDEDECYEKIADREALRDAYELKRKKLTGIYSKQEQAFKDFIDSNINRTTLCYTEEEVNKVCETADNIVVGSDQLWNPAWFDSVFCPKGKKEGQKLISYATSGLSHVDSSNQQIIKRIAERLSAFDYVSVREEVSADILTAYTDRAVEVVLDPTFLLSRKEWETMVIEEVKDKEYVLCFCYGEIQRYKHILKAISCTHDIDKIVIIKMNGHFYETFLEDNMELYEDGGPQEILALIRDASVVCTDSFHGFVFSVIFEKIFYLLERTNVATEDASPERINEVCRKIGIGNRWVYAKKDICSVDDIDYWKVNNYLRAEIEKGKDYLLRAFGD